MKKETLTETDHQQHREVEAFRIRMDGMSIEYKFATQTHSWFTSEVAGEPFQPSTRGTAPQPIRFHEEESDQQGGNHANLS